MKAEIKEITEEMAGNKILANTLNENFKALNTMAEKREGLIGSRLTEMQTKLSEMQSSLKGLANNSDVLELKADVSLLSQNMGKLMSSFGLLPDKNLLTD